MTPTAAEAWALAAAFLDRPFAGGHPLQFGNLPPWLADLLTPEALIAFGGGVLGVGGLRYLLKRRRRSKAGVTVDVSDLLDGDPTTRGGPGTTVRTSAPEGDPDRVIKQIAHGHGSKDGVAFMLPGFLPVSKGIRKVSHDEVHALELGLLVGVITAWLFSTGRIELMVSIVAVFVAGSLGYKRYRTKAFDTVRHEPWYALIAFGAGTAVGFLVFVAEIGLP